MRLHHVGIIVKDVSKSSIIYQDFLGLDLLTDVQEDPIQKVKAIFLGAGWSNAVTLELLEPTSEDSPVMNYLRRGGGIHHICFEVDDIEEEIRKTKEKGGNVVCEPVPACGFNGRRIAFIFPIDNILVELLEADVAKPRP